MNLKGLFTSVPTVTPSEVKKLADKGGAYGFTLLDVRERAEYDRGHLPGAVHIPLSSLAAESGSLDKAGPVVTY